MIEIARAHVKEKETGKIREELALTLGDKCIILPRENAELLQAQLDKLLGRYYGGKSSKWLKAKVEATGEKPIEIELPAKQ